jgi:hypothetical protein
MKPRPFSDRARTSKLPALSEWLVSDSNGLSDLEAAMLKTLTPFGDELALVFDRALLSRLNINEDTKLDVSTDGEVVYIHPIRFARDEEVLRAVRNGMKIRPGRPRTLV